MDDLPSSNVRERRETRWVPLLVVAAIPIVIVVTLLGGVVRGLFERESTDDEARRGSQEQLTAGFQQVFDQMNGVQARVPKGLDDSVTWVSTAMMQDPLPTLVHVLKAPDLTAVPSEKVISAVCRDERMQEPLKRGMAYKYVFNFESGTPPLEVFVDSEVCRQIVAP